MRRNWCRVITYFSGPVLFKEFRTVFSLNLPLLNHSSPLVSCFCIHSQFRWRAGCWQISRSVDQKIIKRDFMRVVMSAEYGGNSKFGRSVKNMIPPSALQSSIIQNKLCMTALSVLTYLSHKARLWAHPRKVALTNFPNPSLTLSDDLRLTAAWGGLMFTI